MVVFYSNSLSPHPSSSRSHPLDPICPYLRSFTAPPPPIIEGRLPLESICTGVQVQKVQKGSFVVQKPVTASPHNSLIHHSMSRLPFQPVYFTSLTSAPKGDDDDGSFDDA